MRGILWRWLFSLGTLFWFALCLADYHQKCLKDTYIFICNYNSKQNITPILRRQFFTIPLPALTVWKWISISIVFSFIIFIKRFNLKNNAILMVSTKRDIQVIKAPDSCKVLYADSNESNIALLPPQIENYQNIKTNVSETLRPEKSIIAKVQKIFEKLEYIENAVKSLYQRLKSPILSDKDIVKNDKQLEDEFLKPLRDCSRTSQKLNSKSSNTVAENLKENINLLEIKKIETLKRINEFLNIQIETELYDSYNEYLQERNSNKINEEFVFKELTENIEFDEIFKSDLINFNNNIAHKPVKHIDSSTNDSIKERQKSKSLVKIQSKHYSVIDFNPNSIDSKKLIVDNSIKYFNKNFGKCEEDITSNIYSELNVKHHNSLTSFNSIPNDEKFKEKQIQDYASKPSKESFKKVFLRMIANNNSSSKNSLSSKSTSASLINRTFSNISLSSKSTNTSIIVLKNELVSKINNIELFMNCNSRTLSTYSSESEDSFFKSTSKTSSYLISNINSIDKTCTVDLFAI